LDGCARARATPVSCPGGKYDLSAGGSAVTQAPTARMKTRKICCVRELQILVLCLETPVKYERFEILTVATTRIHAVISHMIASSIVKQTMLVNLKMDKEIFAEKQVELKIV
jgi:hypothetical protein